MRRPGSRLTSRTACAAAVAALACALAAAPAVADQGDILVKPDAGTSAPEREALRADAGVRLVKPLPVRGVELVHPEDGDPAAALAALRADPAVAWAEEDQPRHAADDPLFPLQWGLQNGGGSCSASRPSPAPTSARPRRGPPRAAPG